MRVILVCILFALTEACLRRNLRFPTSIQRFRSRKLIDQSARLFWQCSSCDVTIIHSHAPRLGFFCVKWPLWMSLFVLSGAIVNDMTSTEQKQQYGMPVAALLLNTNNENPEEDYVYEWQFIADCASRMIYCAKYQKRLISMKGSNGYPRSQLSLGKHQHPPAAPSWCGDCRGRGQSASAHQGMNYQ